MEDPIAKAIDSSAASSESRALEDAMVQEVCWLEKEQGMRNEPCSRGRQVSQDVRELQEQGCQVARHHLFVTSHQEPGTPISEFQC